MTQNTAYGSLRPHLDASSRTNHFVNQIPYFARLQRIGWARDAVLWLAVGQHTGPSHGMHTPPYHLLSPAGVYLHRNFPRGLLRDEDHRAGLLQSIETIRCTVLADKRAAALFTTCYKISFDYLTDYIAKLGVRQSDSQSVTSNPKELVDA